MHPAKIDNDPQGPFSLWRWRLFLEISYGSCSDHAGGESDPAPECGFDRADRIADGFDYFCAHALGVIGDQNIGPSW